jgi:hypothetical protein
MKKLAAATLLVAGLFANCWFVGCHSFSTLRDPPDAANGVRQVSVDSNRVNGLVYYLPKGRIRITGDFKSGSGDAAAKPGSPAGAQLRAGAPSGPSGGDSAEQKNFVVTVAADIEADPSQRYYLKPVRNYFYDDDIRLTVNAKHLLSTGNATAEDQTAKIISTTASLVAAVARPIPAPGAALLKAAELQLPTIGELLFQVESALGDNTISLDTKIAVSRTALEQLGNALPDWQTSPNKNEIKDILDRLKTENKTWFTPKDIRDLLRLFVPERFNEKIQINYSKQVKELFQKLLGALSAGKWFPARPFSIVFDPADGNAAKEELKKIQKCGFDITFEEQPQPEIKLLKEIWEGKNKDVAHGIAFRAVKPCRVEIKSVDNTWFYIRESQLVLLPDTSPDHTLVLDYSRLAFVKKTTNIEFVDGVPQKLAQTAPSSALGFLAIPKGIIEAIVPLPPALTGPPGGVQGPGTSGTTGAPSASPSGP